MSFLIWYASGLVIMLTVFAWQAIKDNPTLAKAANELYNIFIRKANKLSTSVLLLFALFGPLLLIALAYFRFRTWQNSLAVDEDDNRDYPWSKD